MICPDWVCWQNVADMRDRGFELSGGVAKSEVVKGSSGEAYSELERLRSTLVTIGSFPNSSSQETADVESQLGINNRLRHEEGEQGSGQGT